MAVLFMLTPSAVRADGGATVFLGAPRRTQKHCTVLRRDEAHHNSGTSCVCSNVRHERSASYSSIVLMMTMDDRRRENICTPARARKSCSKRSGFSILGSCMRYFPSSFSLLFPHPKPFSLAFLAFVTCNYYYTCNPNPISEGAPAGGRQPSGDRTPDKANACQPEVAN